jgi:segregation and condensation protein B
MINEELQEDQEISLRGLSEAFSQAMGGRSDPQADPDAEPREPPPEEAPREEEADDSCRISPRTILEAMLFVGNRDNQPLESRQAAELMRDVEPEEIPALVDGLNRHYAARGCPYHVVSDGPGYRMTLRKRFFSLRDRFHGRVREARLSQAAIDVLAIVAYRQPLTSDEVSRLRDRPSGHLLAQLVRRRLLRIERPDEKPRKARYFTTDRFLELFGLASIDELPQSEELPRR